MKNDASPIRRVMAINDISCFGKCSLTVTLPILSRFGVEAVPLPTALLSTHTGDFSKPTRLDLTEEMKKIVAHWESFSLKFDCIYTGYMLENQLPVAEEIVKMHAARGAMILIDPVMGDNGYMYLGFGSDFPKKMRRLCRNACVLTPNLTEAMLMTGAEYKNIVAKEERNDLYRRLSDIGAKHVVITGVHPNEREVGDVVIDGDGRVLYEKYLPSTNRRLHGCGDVYASVLCAKLVNGDDICSAVQYAQDFTGKAIEITNRDAQNHWYGLKFESLMDEI